MNKTYGYFDFKGNKVYYDIIGSGKPLLIIHGNSVSSKMHKGFARKLSENFKVISFDLPGHGKSDRLEKWPVDFWFEHCHVVAGLIKHLKLNGPLLLGYSGGAQIAINTALEYPDLVGKVVADSFEGEASVASYAENIMADRARDKKKLMAKVFWRMMHGSDWKRVVDQDSKVIFEHHKKYGRFFHRDIAELKAPVLLTGTTKDEYINNVPLYFAPMEQKLDNYVSRIYDVGKHPASLTVGNEYIEDLVNFAQRP